MYLSSRRTIIAACVLVVVLVTLAGTFRHGGASGYSYYYYPLRGTPLKESLSPLEKLKSNFTTLEGNESKSFWTSEKEQPRFAYAQYATSIDYLCNTIINFSRLKRFGAKNDMALVYPNLWDDEELEALTSVVDDVGMNEEQTQNSIEFAAMNAVRRDYPHVKLRAFDLLAVSNGDETWADSRHKFHAFALTEYTRVLYFDSDSLVLDSMDHYFLAPLAAVAVPRAYWLNEHETNIEDQILGSHVMLIEPSRQRYDKIVAESLSSGDFDMEVINHMFKDSAMILPHRRLALLTREFRTANHSRYLAPDVDEEWDAMREISRSYLVHFSDWPLPKPWMPHTEEQWNEIMPACNPEEPERDDRPKCADRVMWTGIYEDYAHEKDKYCGILNVTMNCQDC